MPTSTDPPRPLDAQDSGAAAASARSRLRQALVKLFNDEDLRTLCFDLGVEYDTLAGRELNGKARELIARFEKDNRIPELIAACREVRPNADWDEIAVVYAQAHRSPTGGESDSPVPLADQQAALDRYLRSLRLVCNALPLAALADDGDPHRRAELTLDRVYIALDTTTQVPVDATRAKREARERRQENLQPGRETRVLPVLEAASAQRQLVILGDPGSGKSTFANYLAYLLAGARTDDATPPEGWSHGPLLPLRFLLRDLAPLLPAEAELDSLPTDRCDLALSEAVRAYLPTLLAASDAGAATPLVRKALDAGQCLVIFDGLDETPPDRRRLVRMGVEAFAKHHAGNRFLVTCRVRSYQGQTRLPSFADVALAPFDPPKIEAFVIGWYAALTDLGQMPRKEAEQRTGNLRQALARLTELAQNPLLLTTMAVVHTAQVELPRERVKLYQRCVEVLLRRWQKHKAGQVPVLTELGVSESVLLAALWEVACAAQASGGRGEVADVPRSQALKILARRLNDDYGKAQRFLEHVDERAGLLVGRGGVDEPVYTFPHRTFQEYLAGCHLALGGRDFGRRLRVLLPEGDRWALAARLGVEHLLYNVGDEHKVLDALYSLCPVVEPRSDSDWRGIQWAGDVAVELGRERILADVEEPDGGPALLERLIPRLVAVIEQGLLPPAERAATGDALGRLGDPRPGVGLTAAGIPDIIWCDVPGGEFMMGNTEGTDEMAYDDEQPQQKIALPAYCIGKYLITNAQYDAFVQDGGYTAAWRRCWTRAGWQWKAKRGVPEKVGGIFDLPNHPVVNVTWYEAMAFRGWLGEKLGYPVTLPAEAQWEKAARGPDGRRFPWGEKITPEHANYDETGIGTTTAVGVFPLGASPYGALDMSGNAWEWCLTQWQEDYTMPAAEDLAVVTLRVLRGGTFHDDAWDVRCASRDWDYPDIWGRNYGFCGFRVVAPPIIHDAGL